MPTCRHEISARVPKPAMWILVTIEPSGAVHAGLIRYQIGEESHGPQDSACREAGPFDSLLELPAWLEDQVVRWLYREYPRL